MKSGAHIPTLRDAGDLAGVRVVVRLSLNVPITPLGDIKESFRIEAALSTLVRLQTARARTVIIAHLSNASASLRPVHQYLQKTLGPIRFINHVPFDAGVLDVGEIALVENTRRFAGEIENDQRFAHTIALGADIFVNDAFADSHRHHASIVGVARLLPSYIGPWFESELRELDRAFLAEHPFELLVGGAKIKSKLPLVKKFLDSADTVFVGGALSNDLFEAKGYEIGRSLVSPDIDLSDILNHPRLELPCDVVITCDGAVRTKKPDALVGRDSIVDIGSQTLLHIQERICRARTIVWNGPMGNTDGGFTDGTEALAKMIADSAAHSIVGGGDTIAAISKLDAFDRFGFVSTGGGAMLEYLSGETLPGIEAIREYWKNESK